MHITLSWFIILFDLSLFFFLIHYDFSIPIKSTIIPTFQGAKLKTVHHHNHLKKKKHKFIKPKQKHLSIPTTIQSIDHRCLHPSQTCQDLSLSKTNLNHGVCMIKKKRQIYYETKKNIFFLIWHFKWNGSWKNDTPS